MTKQPRQRSDVWERQLLAAANPMTPLQTYLHALHRHELEFPLLQLGRSQLARLLREGKRLSPEQRNVAADYLEGKTRTPRHRPRSKDTAITADEVALALIYQEACHPREKRETLVAMVAEAVNRSPRYVYGVSKKIDPERRKIFEGLVSSWGKLQSELSSVDWGQNEAES